MSFDPDSFAPSNNGGRKNRRGSDSYDAPEEYDYDDDSRGSRGEGRFRTIPLVLTVVFGVIALVAIILTFNVGGESTSAADASFKANMMGAGVVSFAVMIFTGRKVVRRR